MKHLSLFLLLFLGVTANAQDVVTFSYDSAGNQIIRNLICISCDDECSTCRKTNQNEISDNEMFPSDVVGISYYPNPVKEQLFIKWDTDYKDISNLQVISLNGQVVFVQENLADKNTTAIQFSHLSEGIYHVVITSTNGEQEVLKIIKK